jgi:long-subunit fatty acid transport protein
MSRTNSVRLSAIAGFLLSFPLQASFIEQTIGAAVVKDATAVYFNPAALTVLSSPQLIGLATGAQARFQFTGSAQKLPLGITESGIATANTHFILPSLYMGTAINETVAAGFALIVNDFYRDLDNHSVLRFVQDRNEVKNVDLVPALGIKLNEMISIGANLNISQAHFIQEPLADLTSLNSPDRSSRNDSKGTSVGGDMGVLIKPYKKTAIGFNYRSAVTYHLRGTSTYSGAPGIISGDYHFDYWTPARSVLSLSHFLNDKLGLIGTVQYIQWDIFKETTVYNFATQVGTRALIIPKAQIHYNFHNSWMLTLGTIYNISPKWIIRAAGTYNQSPSDGQFQISSGDSYIIGSSMGYKLLNNLTIDCSYAHAFFKKEDINIRTLQNRIQGSNEGSHNAVSLKLTITG